MNTPILRTEKLKAYYVLDLHGTQKVVKAVNEVDIEIQENEVYGIAGESGCGKTTLLKTLVAAIEPPLRLIGGKVYYRVTDLEGIEIATTGPRPTLRRTGGGLVVRLMSLFSPQRPREGCAGSTFLTFHRAR